MTVAVKKRAVAAAVCLAAVTVGLAGCRTNTPLAELESRSPTPALSPREVVEIQLQAMSLNDDEDRGIEIAFRFASPGNRASTGPLPRFAAMIRNGYGQMLEPNSPSYAPLLRRGPTAVQRVIIETAEEVAVFDFVLRRQSGGEFDDCWMTEGVYLRAVRRTLAPSPV